GEDEEQDASVDDVGENWDGGLLDRDDEGGSRGAAFGVVGKGEFWRVIPDKRADEEDAEDVEDEDSEEREFDCTGNGLAWVLRFTDGDTDQLRPEVCKCRSDH